MLSTQFIINDPIFITQLLESENLLLTGSSGIGTTNQKIFYLIGIYGSHEDSAEHLLRMLKDGIKITINKQKVIGMSEHVIV